MKYNIFQKLKSIPFSHYVVIRHITRVSEKYVTSVFRVQGEYLDLNATMQKMDFELTVSVQTVINITNCLLQLAMVGSYQQLHVESYPTSLAIIIN